jgi:glucan phosphoethanolaminetransferase (alkaline phosphatase superfamily)
MSDTKPVVWFTDDPKPNTFFFGSPFRSWKFLINTFLLVLLCLAYAIIAWKYWNELNRNSFPHWMVLLTLLITMVLSPFLLALKRHKKINRLYRESKISEQSAESPINDLLQVADNAINEGLFNTSFFFGLFLLVIVVWRLEHFR